MSPPSLATQLKVAPGVLDEPARLICVTTHVRTLSGRASPLGLVTSDVTRATSVAVQPFAGLVTVSVYVPAASTSGVAEVAPETMCPPALATQLKAAPGVLDEPDRLICVTTHVRTLSGPASTFGGATSDVTSATSVAVHPFAGLVTVSVYVPAASTSGVAEVAPETMCPPALAFQLKGAPGVLDEPARLICVTTHVRTLSGPASTFGGVTSEVTSATSVAVHPFAGLVTVSVYVPAASTSGVAVAAPETM